MTEGPLLGKIISFTLPIMLSSLLQLLFNAADMIVVGRFAGDISLAAVGATSALINLLVNVTLGLSIGSNVVVANYHGSGDSRGVSETVHTSILVSLICGVSVGILGILTSRTLLIWMETPETVLDLSAVYMKIYFAGLPVTFLYNFGSSVLRSVGDTKRPLVYLSIAGVLNVFLNLFFVIVLKMDVAGVALATVISQTVSASLVLITLARDNESWKFDYRKLKIHKDKLIKILRIGLPAGLQSAIFSISNVLIQSSINSFGDIAMAGNTADGSLEGFNFVAMDAFSHAALTFTSQNVGAKKYERLNRILWETLVLVTVVGVTIGTLTMVFGKQLLGIYLPGSEEAIGYGLVRMKIISVTYFTCGIMNVIVGAMRGMGYSIEPMIITLGGVCGLRILWIYTVFAFKRTLEILYLSYPISWVASIIIDVIVYVILRRKFRKLYMS